MVAFATAGCTGSVEAKHTQESTSDDARVTATPRALAASVLSHLEPEDVADVRGSVDDSGLRASITTHDTAVESIFVQVSHPFPGSDSCGNDSGFEQVACAEGAEFSEIVVSDRVRPHSPTYIARAQSETRGHVLIEVWGGPGPEVEQLVRTLVDDQLIGFTTSPELIAEGDAISEFDDLEIVTELKMLS